MAEATPKATKKVAAKPAKANTASAKPEAKKAAPKAAATTKKPTETKPVEAAAKAAVKKAPAKKPAKVVISDEQRYRMIAEAAYYRAESRQFKSDPLRDWIEAERDISILLSERS